VRTAVAACRVELGAEALVALRDGRLARVDALPSARVAGVLGGRQTSHLLPFCHDVLLQDVEIDFEFDEAAGAVELRAAVKSEGAAGVEMEAMTAVSIAALAIYDACKSLILLRAGPPVDHGRLLGCPAEVVQGPGRHAFAECPAAEHRPPTDHGP
jgi:molybdenum cofactor biosynthesis protein MoaC